MTSIKDLRAEYGIEKASEKEQANFDQKLYLSKKIYDRRKELKLTQGEVAKLAGTTQSVISRLEEGGADSANIKTLYKLAQILDLNLSITLEPV